MQTRRHPRSGRDRTVGLVGGAFVVCVTIALFVPIAVRPEGASSGPSAESAPAAAPAEVASAPSPGAEKDDTRVALEFLQGPALAVPREVIDMLDQRRRHLDRREAALLGAEERLLILKAELEQLLTKYEKLAEAQQAKGAAGSKREGDQQRRREKDLADRRNQFQAQLAKIYESMPAEEAAARLERMPERKAIEVLRILKGKSAGAILAAVRPDRAARLTEQLLAPP